MKVNLATKALQLLCHDFRQDIVDGPFGSELKRTDYIEEGVPVLKIQNVKAFAIELKRMDYVSSAKFQELRRHSFRRGDIVMTKLGSPLGVSAIVEDMDEGIIVADLVRIRAQKINTKYLCYQLNSERTSAFINSMQKGTTRPRVTLSVVRELPIFVPEINEQDRIVAILDEAFDGIATAKADAEKNLQNARTIFACSLHSAIAGELTRDWRRVQVTVESASTDQMRRVTERANCSAAKGKTDAVVVGKAIHIPKGWILVSPEQVSTHIVDCPHSTPKWASYGVVCLRTTNFKPRYLDLESVRFVSEETYSERIMRLEPATGDVLYSREGGILGIACIIPEQLKTCLGQRMMLFRLDVNLALPEYFAALLNSTMIFSEVRRLVGGAAAPHLNIRDIRKFPIPLPPIDEQRQIMTKLDAISAETQRLESLYQQKLTALAELKKSLLHEAFSGRL